MSAARKTSPDHAWVAQWLDDVVDGSKTMSRRTVATVIDKVGSVKALAILARERGVHLLQLEDDRGAVLIAASLKPFKVVC